MIKFAEKLADLVVWVTIIAAILAFIYGMAQLPFWASSISAGLLVAVMMLWD